jgi:hypothetical protein
MAHMSEPHRNRKTNAAKIRAMYRAGNRNDTDHSPVVSRDDLVAIRNHMLTLNDDTTTMSGQWS